MDYAGAAGKLGCNLEHAPAGDDDVDCSRNDHTLVVRTYEEDNKRDAGQLQDACA